MKRGMSLALALAIVLALGVGTTAQASSRLTLKQAKRVALKLKREQKRKFNLRANHVGKAHRLGRTRIAFAYDARTKPGTYCTATLRVRKSVNGRHIRYRARIGRQDCLTIPDDALAAERATRKAQRAIRVRATRRSLTRLTHRLSRCENMRVPKRRRAAVHAVIDVATTNALVQPNVDALDRFVGRLSRIDDPHRPLGDGIAGWLEYVGIVEGLPSYPHPCGTLRDWRDAGWSADESPIDMRDYRRAAHRAARDRRAIDRASRFLARVGILPRQVVGFTPDGLLFYLAAD
jgi:hypothetical protein